MIDKKRIFIVDDDPDVLLQIELGFKELNQEGLECSYFLSAEELFEQLEKNSTTDLIVTDLNMAEMTGVDLLCKIRANERYSHLPIAIISENFSKTDEELLYGIGANYVFQKPSNYDGFQSLCQSFYNFWLRDNIVELRNIFLGNIQLQTTADLSKTSFIIVDNSILERLMLEKIISKLKPKQLLYAFDGARAVNLFKQLAKEGEEHVVLLMNYDLPVLNGYKTAELIRNYERKKLKRTITSIIINTDHKINDDESHIFNEVIHRPYQIDEVARTISNLFRNVY